MSNYDPIPSTATPRLSVEGPSPGGGDIRLESPDEPLVPRISGAKLEEARRASSDSDGSDLIYRDAVDDDIVDEKRALRSEASGYGQDPRWEGEGGMENGYEGYVQPPRVS